LTERCQEKYDNIPVKDVKMFFNNKKVFEALREVYAECVKNSDASTPAYVVEKSQSLLRNRYRHAIEVTTHDAKIYHQILLDEGLSGAPGWGHADGEVACPKLLVLGAAEVPEAMETASDAARPDASIREKSTTEEEMVEAVCRNTHTHTHSLHTVSIYSLHTVSIQ
jgi:hypothetical protein